jgi:hypothetical protein
MEAQFLDASEALRSQRRQEDYERQQRELAQGQALTTEQKKRAGPWLPDAQNQRDCFEPPKELGKRRKISCRPRSAGATTHTCACIRACGINLE